MLGEDRTLDTGSTNQSFTTKLRAPFFDKIRINNPYVIPYTTVMKKIVGKDFFNRKTETVAKELLGRYLVRKVRLRRGYVVIKERITEVEAYVGPHDLACHSSKGRTKRNEVMYCEAGTIYVYFVYGMYWMLNIVTEKKEYPAAILIRATESASRRIKGPGVLTRELKIDGRLNGKKLGKKTGLWIESDLPAKTGGSANPNGGKIMRMPRVGVGYAGPIWSKEKLRFVLSQAKS